jgi:hypothetical protein
LERLTLAAIAHRSNGDLVVVSSSTVVCGAIARRMSRWGWRTVASYNGGTKKFLGRGGAATGHDPTGVNSVEKKGYFFIFDIYFFKWADMWDPVLFLPHHQMNFCLCHLSTDMWAPLSEIVSIYY